MSRSEILVGCIIGLLLEVGVVLTVADPAFRVQEGMTYTEVEQTLGPQLPGLRPCSLIDGSWTGVWDSPYGMIEVTFDSRDRVRESPSIARRVLRGVGF